MYAPIGVQVDENKRQEYLKELRDTLKEETDPKKQQEIQNKIMQSEEFGYLP